MCIYIKNLKKLIYIYVFNTDREWFLLKLPEVMKKTYIKTADLLLE